MAAAAGSAGASGSQIDAFIAMSRARYAEEGVKVPEDVEKAIQVIKADKNYAVFLDLLEKNDFTGAQRVARLINLSLFDKLGSGALAHMIQRIADPEDVAKASKQELEGRVSLVSHLQAVGGASLKDAVPEVNNLIAVFAKTMKKENQG